MTDFEKEKLLIELSAKNLAYFEAIKERKSLDVLNKLFDEIIEIEKKLQQQKDSENPI